MVDPDFTSSLDLSPSIYIYITFYIYIYIYISIYLSLYPSMKLSSFLPLR